MTFLDFLRGQRIVFAPEGEGAGGDGGQGGGADDQTKGGSDGGGGDGGGQGGKWWDAPEYTPEEKQWMAARGLTEDDATKVIPKLVKGHRAAEQRLGKGLESIMDRPAKDQKLSDWMREQKDIFGLPASDAEYKIEKPEALKDGIAWDGEFEAAAKKLAFEQGILPSQLQAMTNFYAGKVAAMGKAADDAFEAANTKMMGEINKDWGKEAPAKMAQARQAAQVLGEKAGLDAAGIAAVSSVISEKAGGDAATIKLFAALADMMGDDRLVQGGGGQFGTTPAEARAQIAQLQGPDGAYSKAVAARNPVEMARLKPEIERLTKIAAGK